MTNTTNKYFYRVYGSDGTGEVIIDEFYSTTIITDDNYIEFCKEDSNEEWLEYVESMLHIRVERMTLLKAVREAKRMSQKQLADVSGVSYRMIQHYEQGTKDIKGAAVVTVIKLADALGVTVKDII